MQCPMQLQRRLRLLKYFRRRLTLRRLMRLAPQRTRCARYAGEARFTAFAARQFLAFAHFACAREPLLVRGANRPYFPYPPYLLSFFIFTTSYNVDYVM